MRCLRMSPFFYSVLLLIFLAQPGTVVGQQGTPAGWTPELSMKLKNVGAVRVSPDARKVAYTVSQAVMTPERSEYVTQIWTNLMSFIGTADIPSFIPDYFGGQPWENLDLY